jgi:hypothetical protein
VRRPLLFLNLLIINFIMLNNYSYASELPEAKIAVKVLAEDGKSMSGEEVSVGFAVPEEGRQGIKDVIINGFTDSTGLYTVSHKTIGIVGSRINKDGYYGSYGEYRFHEEQGGKWLPWDSEIKLLLRKKENPVPMYARNTQMSGLEVPAVGKEIGFDLIEYEWMPPHGKGKHADFIFKIDRKFKNDRDFYSTLTITFSGKYDGIQLIKQNRKYGSAFKLPRFAPKTGYRSKLIRTMKRIPGKPIESDFAEDNNYIFRVRSEENDGKFVRAMYGKIQGDIEVEPRGRQTATILFTYYLNPDYTRNLEYGSDLFMNLRAGEVPGLE